MASNLQTLSRRLHALCPFVPVLVCQQFVQWRYREILDKYGKAWSFQTQRGNWSIGAPYVGTGVVSPGGNTVTGVTGVTLPGDRHTIVGMQCYFNNMAPVYDIVDNLSPSSFTVFPAWGGWSASANQTQSFMISNSFFTPSASQQFERFISFVDPIYSKQMRTNRRIEWIDKIDKMRTSVGTTLAWAARGANADYIAALPAGVTDMFGQTNASTPVPRWEPWPRQVAPYVWYYSYKSRLSELVNPTDTPAGFVNDQVIIEGALADACAYPGTPSLPNPQANPVLAQTHNRRFQELLTDARLIDKSVAQGDATDIDDMISLPWMEPESDRYSMTHVMEQGS